MNGIHQPVTITGIENRERTRRPSPKANEIKLTEEDAFMPGTFAVS